MRVDLVAPPIRYPRTPLLALLLVAVIPVAALVPLLVWSDAKADEYEASQAAEDAVTGVTTTVPAGGQVGAAAPLTTGLFDFRRAPRPSRRSPTPMRSPSRSTRCTGTWARGRARRCRSMAVT